MELKSINGKVDAADEFPADEFGALKRLVFISFNITHQRFLNGI